MKKIAIQKSAHKLQLQSKRILCKNITIPPKWKINVICKKQNITYHLLLRSFFHSLQEYYSSSKVKIILVCNNTYVAPVVFCSLQEYYCCLESERWLSAKHGWLDRIMAILCRWPIVRFLCVGNRINVLYYVAHENQGYFKFEKLGSEIQDSYANWDHYSL